MKHLHAPVPAVAVSFHLCPWIDLVLRDVREPVICLPFFSKRLLQKIGGVVMPQQAGMCPGGAVCRDLVVLHSLGGSDQCCLLRILAPLGIEHLGTFRNHPLHSYALLSLGGDVQFLADLLDPLRVGAGLFQVLLERIAQRAVAGLRHLRQGLNDLVFCTVDVLQLIGQNIFKALHFHDALRLFLFLPVFVTRYTCCSLDNGKA